MGRRGRLGVVAAGLVVAFGGPAVALAGIHGGAGAAALAAAGLMMLTPWLTLAWVRWVEGDRLGSIGIGRPDLGTLLFGVAGIAVNVLVSLAMGRLNAWLGLHEVQSALMTRLLLGPGWVLVLALGNGALLTEISFRAYGLERLTELLGGRRGWGMAAQVAITTGLFVASRGVAHGAVWLVDDVLFSLFYFWRRDTAACLMAHLVPNLAAAVLVAAGVAH